MITQRVNAPVWVVSRELLRFRADELGKCWLRVRRTSEPEGFHDLRVASRRLREAIKLFAPCYPRHNMTRLRKDLRQLTRDLGQIRNTDEAIAYLEPLEELLPGDQQLAFGETLTRLKGERKKELFRLTENLRKLDLIALQSDLLRTINRPYLFSSAPIDPFTPIGNYLQAYLEEREQPVLQLLPAALHAEDHQSQHRLRIAIKKYRYVLELLMLLKLEASAPLISGVKEYQEVLGTIHDLDVFTELLQKPAFRQCWSNDLAHELASRRHRSFLGFLVLHENSPLTELCCQARSLL